MKITYNEAISEIRKEAREAGLVLRRSNTKRYDGVALYYLYNVSRNEVVHQNTFWGMYEDYASGYISTYDKNTNSFK